MHNQLMRRSLILGLLTIVLTIAFPSTSQADPLVLRGYDLFTTVPESTKVNLGPAGIQPFKGVPIGTFDFGSGPVNTGDADTIVQRLGDASPANPTIPLEMVALQLMSVNQFNLGAGNGFHFITLQSIRGGPASTGFATLTFGPEGTPHGTFNVTLDVFFDVRFDALNGPILLSGMKTITATNVPWTHFPPPGALLIPGVNFMLNGENQLNDFFPIGLVMHVNPDGSMHTVQTSIPEPTTISLLALGIAGVAARVRKRRRQEKSAAGQ